MTDSLLKRYYIIPIGTAVGTFFVLRCAFVCCLTVLQKTGTFANEDRLGNVSHLEMGGE